MQRLTVLLFLLSPLLVWSPRGLSAQDAAGQPFAFKKLVLIPVMEPPRLTIENRGAPLQALGFVGYFVKNKIEDNRSNDLSTSIRNQGVIFGREMTEALAEELTKAGYSVEVINKVKRAYDDPDDIDYASIQTEADAIISAKYDEAGLYAGQFSTYYIPRLNLEVDVVSVGNRERIKSLSANYGVDAKERTDEDIPSDPKYAYESFDKVLEKQEEVAESYRIGIREIAALVAKQLNQPEH